MSVQKNHVQPTESEVTQAPVDENPLSEREMEVSRLLVTGATNAEIARALVISPHTVKVHLRNVFEKLQVSSRTEATMVLLQRGWLTMPGVAVAPALEPPLDAEPPDAEPVVAADPPPLANLAAQPQLWQQLVLLGALVVCLLALVLPTWLGRPKSSIGLLSDGGQTVVGEPAVEMINRWETRAPLAQARSRTSAVQTGGKIYVIGGEGAQGETLDTLDIYDLRANRWLAGPPLPEALANAATTIVAGQVLVAGGSANTGVAGNTVTVSNDLYLFDLMAAAWRHGGRLPVPLAGAGLVAYNGALYLLGGWDGNATRDEVWRLPVERLGDVAPADWTVATRLERPVAFMGATLVDSELVVTGGFDGRRELADAAAYDLETGDWRRLPPMATPRSGHVLIYDGVAVLALGGGWTRTITSHERYDALTNQWTDLPSPIRGEWRHFAAALNDGSVYLIGGWSGDYLDINLQYQSTFRALLPAIPNISDND